MATENIATETAHEAPATAEERFFGVTTPIDTESTPEPVDAPTSPEVEIEAEERTPQAATPPAKSADDDDDLTKHSDKVEKRIKKLTWEKHEERRRAEAAEKMREEAVRVAQHLNSQVQDQQNLIQTGEATLVEKFKTSAARAVENAKAAYKKAYEEGDTDAIIEAQQAQIQAQAEQQEANRYEADYQYRSQQQQDYQQQQQYFEQQRQQYQPPQPQVPQPSPETETWAEQNPWFGSDEHKDMTALAYGIHERLVRDEGVTPDSPEYFQAIDGEMHVRFPEYFAEAQGTEAASIQHSQPTVVAPAQRNNGARPRKVKLTQTQVALAKRIGITPEQYANQLIAEMKGN
jgi:hypothetical protein